MAKTRPGRRELAQYSIKGTNKIVRAGDCVLMRSSENGKPPYVARVENIEADNRNNIKVRVRWYYRPEESSGGRRKFHGSKELFLSNHFDIQSADTIEGKCVVHTFKAYTKLENVGTEDYFSRFEYDAATGGFVPDRIVVYCKCELPYNPDDLMVQCEDCKDWIGEIYGATKGKKCPCCTNILHAVISLWFHPACVGMTIEKAKLLEQFVCSDCASDDVNKPGTPSLPENDKVGPKRQKR